MINNKRNCVIWLSLSTSVMLNKRGVKDKVVTVGKELSKELDRDKDKFRCR